MAYWTWICKIKQQYKSEEQPMLLADTHMTTVTGVDIQWQPYYLYTSNSFLHGDSDWLGQLHSIYRDKHHHKWNEKRCVRYEWHAACCVVYSTSWSLCDGTRYRTWKHELLSVFSEGSCLSPKEYMELIDLRKKR